MGARMAIYAHIYGSSNGHVCAYLWPCMRISMGHVCAYLWAMYAHIYGSSNGHICAHLGGQPCKQIILSGPENVQPVLRMLSRY